MLNNPKWNAPSRTDFIDWLGGHDRDERYEYNDGCGGCLMGRYMAARGIAWDMNVYLQMVTEVLDRDVTVLTGSPRTFGGALNRAVNMTESGQGVSMYCFMDDI